MTTYWKTMDLYINSLFSFFNKGMEISFENFYVDQGAERGNVLLSSRSQISEIAADGACGFNPYPTRFI